MDTMFFYDPKYAQHPLKARLAQIALCLSQLIGITIYTLTTHENKLLSGWISGKNCRITGHALPESLGNELQIFDLGKDSKTSLLNAGGSKRSRQIDVLFIGRPTAQKGWHFSSKSQKILA